MLELIMDMEEDTDMEDMDMVGRVDMVDMVAMVMVATGDILGVGIMDIMVDMVTHGEDNMVIKTV